jgi:hypothetical protein
MATENKISKIEKIHFHTGLISSFHNTYTSMLKKIKELRA